MNLWRRASKGERCGFCGFVFQGARDQHPGEPIMLYGTAGLKRCASCAKSRYGADVPVPFPDPVPPHLPQIRQPDFVASRSLARWADRKMKQAGEQTE